MGFYERYELLELDRDDGVKTFQAREVATGRPVKVHLFPVPAAPYQAHLLKEIDELPESESARILDRGSHLGTRYVVTDRLVDYPGLLEWVSASLKAAAGKAPGASMSDPAVTSKNVAGKDVVEEKAVPRKITIPSANPPAASFARPSATPPRSAPANSAPPSPAFSPRVPVQDSELNRQFADLFTTAERPVFVPPPAAPVAPPAIPVGRTSNVPQAPASPARKMNLLVILGYTAVGLVALLITMFFMLRRR